MKKFLRSKKNVVVLLIALVAFTSVAAASFYSATKDDVPKQDNGFYTMYGGERGQFDKEKTPITNMVILLKILNSGDLCDNDWFKELRNYESMIKKQIVDNKKSKDEVTKKILGKQKVVLDALAPISSLGKGKKVTDKDIETLRSAYNEYRDYYEGVYGKGVESHE